MDIRYRISPRPELCFLELSNHRGHDFLSPFFPLFPVLHGISKVLIRTHTKHIALLQFRRQRNDVVVKEGQLALVPEGARIGTQSSSLVRSVHLLKQSAIPLLVDVPVLHRVGHIRGLNDVFHDNRGA